MNVEHLAIDGSVITIEAEADLSTRATAAGWAIVPSLMQSHPFAVFPPGYTRLAEDAARANAASLEILSREEFRLKDGTLRVAEVRARAAAGGANEMTVGAWEGETGCLTTSLRGRETKRLVEAFDTLKFRARRGGLAIDSPVMPVPRTPEVITEIPGVAVLAIRPALASELERVPRPRGFAAAGGELFRIRKTSESLLFVSRTTVVNLTPTAKHGGRELLDVAGGLRIEWAPRGAAR